jgi:hypothetical protein
MRTFKLLKKNLTKAVKTNVLVIIDTADITVIGMDNTFRSQ